MKKILIIGGVILLAAVAVWFVFFLPRTTGKPSAPTAKDDAPPGWVPKEEYEPTPWYKKLSPTYRPSTADKALKSWPRGSRVVHVETEKGEHVEVGILPDGEVVVPSGQPHEVTVYHKPERNIAFEARPFIGAGLATNGIAAVGGVDLLRAWKFHAGPGVAVNFKRDAEDDVAVGVAGVGAVALNVWRNIDARVYGGANFDGEKVFGGGITVAIVATD